MDKPLPDNDKKENSTGISPSAGKGEAVPATDTNPTAPDFKKANIGAYASGNDNPVERIEEEWDEAKKQAKKGQPWKESRRNRLAIRVFSRGVLGALFFAGMGWYARPGKELWKGMGEYDPNRPGSAEWKKPLTVIAKIFDSLAGTPIKSTIKLITADAAVADRAVRFRPSAKEFSDSVKGRSLGAEIVGVTADFASMSIGDALGRDLVDLFDPNIKRSWRDEKGHLKPTEMVKSMAKTGWRYVSYNAGEDWAVALPYVYFMRGLKHGLGNISPGFRYDSDRNLNGGSLKIDANSNVIGNYNKAGLVDLQGRFTFYNMGTLLYREAYNYAADKWWHHRPTRLYGAPDAPIDKKDEGIAGTLAYLAKWVTRGVIKAGIYMTPTVPFFWITRTPQSKYKGLFIDPKTKEVLGYRDATDGRPQAVHANEIGTRYEEGKYFSPDTPVYRNRYSKDIHNWELRPGDPFVRVTNPHVNPDFNAYAKSFGIVDTALNGIGSTSNAVRKKFHHIPRRLGYRMDPQHFEIFKRSTDRYWNAAISYTPYFMVKTELANLWDTGKTDIATERLIEGAASLNWNEFKAGAGELWSSIKGQRLADPAREAEAQRRNLSHIAADEALEKSQSRVDEEHREVTEKLVEKAERQRNTDPKARPAETPVQKADDKWQDRFVISGEKPEKKRERKSIMPPPEQKPKQSFADQEAMRKLLTDLTPPTNSKH